MTLPAAAILEISGPALATILESAVTSWPRECCGMLVGRRDGDCAVVTRAVAATNVAENPGRRFEVDPRTLLATHRAAREAGEEVLGPYHSHPTGRADPSATDTGRAVAAGEYWLIVPVRATGAGRGQAGDARAYVFDGTAFAEVPLRVAT